MSFCWWGGTRYRQPYAVVHSLCPNVVGGTYPSRMTTVIAGPPPPEVEALLQRRSALGLDGRDECWGGVYYVAPHADLSHGAIGAQVSARLLPRAEDRGLIAVVEFNLGTGPQDFTVPDGGVLASAQGVYAATALVVVEVLSPDDATWQKFDHYAAHDVAEILVVDPVSRSVRGFRLVDGAYAETDTCVTLDLPLAELSATIRWP